MKAVILLGSIRANSFTRALAQRVSLALESRSIATDWVDPAAQPLPIADPEFHHNVAQTPSEAVRQMVAKIDGAEGVILASPLYHGSYSGVLKNALDCLAYDAFRDKPVGLLAHGSGAKRCAQAAEHLVPVVRTLYGHALQCQVASSKADFTLDEASGAPVLTDADTASRCERLAEEMKKFLLRKGNQ